MFSIFYWQEMIQSWPPSQYCWTVFKTGIFCVKEDCNHTWYFSYFAKFLCWDCTQCSLLCWIVGVRATVLCGNHYASSVHITRQRTLFWHRFAYGFIVWASTAFISSRTFFLSSEKRPFIPQCLLDRLRSFLKGFIVFSLKFGSFPT